MAYNNDTYFSGPTSYQQAAAGSFAVIDVRKEKMVYINLSGLTTDTITLDISPDNVNWTVGVMPINLLTNANAASTALGNGSYSFGGAALPCAYIRLTKTGAATTCTALIGLRY